MRTQNLCLAIACLILLALTTPAHAYWPRTLEENLAIAADPNVFESFPHTVPYPNGRIFVTYQHYELGDCYQIIDRFGNFELPQNTLLAPGLPFQFRRGDAQAISDGHGGVFVSWTTSGSLPDSLNGIYAQHLDSLGNRLWGDSSLRIYPQRVGGIIYMPICEDGLGGFFMAVRLGGGEPPLYAQHIDHDGNLLWGPTGVLVFNGTNMPAIADDLDGGCYVIWRTYQGGLYNIYGQRLSESGELLWGESGVYISGEDWGHKIIADGEGMIIEQAPPEGCDYNVHRRINNNGQVLWTRDHLSWGGEGRMELGEPNYFYLGFITYWTSNYYVQRVNLNGVPQWAGAYGDTIYSRVGWVLVGDMAYSYGYPFYYFAGGVQPYPGTRQYLITQYVDSLGNHQMGEYGTTLSGFGISSGSFYYISVIPIEGDIVVVYQTQIGNSYDVWAKRCHADGTLGGPFPIGVTVTPHNPPIQIPPQGGSFSFDIAVADTDTVGGSFDAWVEVVLPGDRTQQLTARRHLNMPTGGTISKPNLTQVVPAYAPAGLYTYRVCAGDDSFKIPWGEGSFTFEKLVEVDATSSRSPSRPRLGRLGWDSPDSSGWVLQGDFFKEGIAVGAHCVRPVKSETLSGSEATPTMSVKPNPFNPDIDISFVLSNAQHIELAIYDLRGSKVETITDGVLPPGLHTYNWNGERHSAGIYFVRLSTESQSVVKKVTLLK